MPLDYAPLQNAREVATFFALPAGDFVVMPNSVQHREGKFLLRILADQHADVWEINEDNLVVHSIQNDFGDDRTVEYVSIVSSILVKAIDFHWEFSVSKDYLSSLSKHVFLSFWWK